MKIFGKRTRKSIESSSSERVTQGTPEVKSDADQKVVEELLKQDPSTWNAKQRRMVKRYQERGGTIEDTTGNKETQRASKDNSEQNNASSRTEENSEAPMVPVTQDKEAVDDDEAKESMEETGDQDEKAVNDEPKASSEDPEQLNENGEKSTIDPDLQNLLNKLSSKPRRKLTRMLEREGNVEIVRKEAMKLLEEKEAESNIPEAKKADAVIPDSADEPSRKRRRKTVDISSLPVEEKLRREEQRRLQKESLERRASGEQLQTGKHRHPLNSERRRANKRKPKYATKRIKVGNEHDTSGFHMRRAQET